MRRKREEEGKTDGREQYRQDDGCQGGKRKRKQKYPTFFHRDGTDAKQEMAATIQQLPRLPWCKSRVLMPSTNRRGSLHISWSLIRTKRH